MSTFIDVYMPDIGDSKDVEVIELLVGPGDIVKKEDSLLTVESDKASMDIPSSAAGVVKEIKLAVGSKANEGDLIAVLECTADTAEEAATTEAPTTTAPPPAAPSPAAEVTPAPPKVEHVPSATTEHSESHASPAIRKFARELGVDLSQISGTGLKGRVVKEDIEAYIKGVLKGTTNTAAAGAGIPPIPSIDFSQFGEIERVEMGRIPQLSAANLHRAWLNVPMVTHHDEADITELEAFRRSLKAEAEQTGVRVTALVFHMKALAACLKEFPKFNSSITPDGTALIYKKYIHIGIAVETPNGLVVPVFRDVDKKSITTLSAEIMDISQRARNKKLSAAEMQGASMTISSLGGIGGTAFTPIVNAPEAAIMGISRARMQPVWNGEDFVPRLICPLDMTYDHRIIDGADAARFVVHYCKLISDVRRILL